MTKASVIIPAYNVEKYLHKAVQSVLDQSERDFEAIIVDDASTDRTKQIAEQLASADERIKFIPFNENKGNSAARNAALDIARGDWIAILDADDWYSPDRLETLIKLGESEGVEIVADNQYFIAEDDDRPWRTLLRSTKDAARQLSLADFLRRCRSGQFRYLDVLKPVVRRSLLADHGLVYDEEMRRGSDFDFLLKCLAKSRRFLLYERPLYYYRNHSNSITASYSIEDYIEKCEINERYLDLFPDKADASIRKLVRGRCRSIEKFARYRQLVHFIAHRQWGAATAHLSKYASFFPYFALSIWRALLGRIRKVASA